MGGFKVIKTTYGKQKEIVGVKFNGRGSYNSFIREVKTVFNISQGFGVQIYSKEFIVKPHIFEHFVAQYINNLDFELNVKVTTSSVKEVRETTSSYFNKIPTTNEIEGMAEIQELLMIQNLENKHRTRIAKIIITAILTENPDRRLLREEFLQLAQSIVEVFPTEVKETYYVPFTKGHLAKGKLYDAYNNKRARLSSSGLIRRRQKYKPQPPVVNDDTLMLSESDVDENQLEILKTGWADWSLVLEIWRKSFTFRRNELRTENLNFADYMDKYKVLQHAKNYELCQLDFKMLYPYSKSIDEWRFYYDKIIDKADKLRDNSGRDILNYIQNTWQEESKLALSLLLVPYLLPSSRLRSKSEVQESFITYCKNVVKLEELDDEDSSYSTKRFKLEYQPKIYFVGDCVKPIKFAYMDFLGRRHTFQDPLQAVEVCFHCFIGSNTKYPKSCEHVWLFLQKLVFRINTPDDAVIPATNTLINDLRQQ